MKLNESLTQKVDKIPGNRQSVIRRKVRETEKGEKFLSMDIIIIRSNGCVEVFCFKHMYTFMNNKYSFGIWIWT